MAERNDFQRVWFKGFPDQIGTYLCRTEGAKFPFDALWDGSYWIKDTFIISGIIEWSQMPISCPDVLKPNEEFKHGAPYINPRSPESLKASTIAERTADQGENIKDWFESRGGVISDESLTNFNTLRKEALDNFLYGSGGRLSAEEVKEPPISINGEMKRLKELSNLYTNLENQSTMLVTNINRCPYLLSEEEAFSELSTEASLPEELKSLNDILYARYYRIKENLEIIKNLIG